MDYIILTISLFVTLCLNKYYYDYIDSPTEARSKIHQQTKSQWLLLLPVIITAGLLWWLPPEERMLANGFYWLMFLFYYFLLTKKYSLLWSILIAAVLALIGIAVVFITGSEGLNNLLVIISYCGACTLLLHYIRWPLLYWRIIFGVLFLYDLYFVWFKPVIVVIDQKMQSHIFSLLLKFGDISLGAGDLACLLIAMLLLTRKRNEIQIQITALCLSGLILLVPLAHYLWPSNSTSFPFLILLAPIFMLISLLPEQKTKRALP
jgi:hypothetical protein